MISCSACNSYLTTLKPSECFLPFSEAKAAAKEKQTLPRNTSKPPASSVTKLLFPNSKTRKKTSFSCFQYQKYFTSHGSCSNVETRKVDAENFMKTCEKIQRAHNSRVFGQRQLLLWQLFPFAWSGSLSEFADTRSWFTLAQIELTPLPVTGASNLFPGWVEWAVKCNRNCRVRDSKCIWLFAIQGHFVSVFSPGTKLAFKTMVLGHISPKKILALICQFSEQSWGQPEMALIKRHVWGVSTSTWTCLWALTMHCAPGSRHWTRGHQNWTVCWWKPNQDLFAFLVSVFPCFIQRSISKAISFWCSTWVWTASHAVEWDLGASAKRKLFQQVTDGVCEWDDSQLPFAAPAGIAVSLILCHKFCFSSGLDCSGFQQSEMYEVKFSYPWDESWSQSKQCFVLLVSSSAISRRQCRCHAQQPFKIVAMRYS